jgi:uncharacterized iron-regulated membrane protein
MYRLLVLVHRYLGIAVGFIVALWCLSGFVMMYVQYPDLDKQEYLAGLPAIDTSNCCVVNRDVLDQLDGVDQVTVEMLAGQPVLRARFGRDISLLVDLASGWWYQSIDQETAMQQADAFMAASGIDGEARFLARITHDQWTVAGYFDVHRPLFLLTAGDESETHIYVSGVDGRVVQTTTSGERFWNWFGAVIHWIYPTTLRQDTELWSQIVIWLSIISLFLVLVGIYLGIKQFRFRASGSRSPYRGLNLWHHYSGLIFGLVTVTWLFSGLLSMNPWGAFEGDSGNEERRRLARRALAATEVTAIVQALDNSTLPAGTARLASSIVDGELALIAQDADGNAARVDGRTLQPYPLPDTIWQRVAQLAKPGTPVLQAGFIEAEDNYYFSHHEKVSFPVYRIVFDDTGQTRYYFDATSAELVEKYDSDRRWHRWLFLGLHRGDFTSLMRTRPLWDLILLPLMLGVTAAAITGVWMAYRRLTR